MGFSAIAWIVSFNFKIKAKNNISDYTGPDFWIMTELEIEEIERRCDMMISFLAPGDKSEAVEPYQLEKKTDFDKLDFCEK